MNKTVNIETQYLQYGGKSDKTKKRKKNKEIVSQIKTNNIKELLLEKLKEYKKKKKSNNSNHEVIQTSSQNMMPIVSSSSSKISVPIVPSQHAIVMTPPPPPPPSSILSCHKPLPISLVPNKPIIDSIKEKPYGNLKNGKKPCFRQFVKSMKKHKHPKQKKINMQIEKKFMVGRNLTQKKVGIFIKNLNNRRHIEEIKQNSKMKSLKDMKAFLKKKNFIKSGSYAPSELVQEIYTNVKLCGCKLKNTNSRYLVHNYLNDN